MPQRKRVAKKNATKNKKVSRSVSSRTVHSRVTRRKPLPAKRNNINWTESYSSFLLGIVVVIVAVLFGVSLIRQQNNQHLHQTSSLSTGPTQTPTSNPTPTPGQTVVENGKTYYIVQPNDSLWIIAQKVYNNGYKWVDIARANNLVNPGDIYTGNKLYLPNAPVPSELGSLIHKITPTPTTSNPEAITGRTYTVERGDSLWTIAIRAYNDGYQWTKIATANNLANPNLIFSGNILTIPR